MKHLLIALGLLLCLPTPTIAQSANYTDFGIYFDRFCGLLDDGNVECTSSNFPKVDTLQPPANVTFNEVDSGFLANCGITTTAEVECWGTEGPDGEIFPPSFDLPVVQLSVAAYHACAVDNEGDAKCWGQNVHGQTEPPQAPEGFIDVEAFSIYYSCGVTSVGELLCWGKPNDHLIPADLASRSASQIVDFEAGEETACVIYNDGNASCWEIRAGSPEVAAFTGGPYKQVWPLRSNGDFLVCAMTFNGEIDCVPGKSRTESPDDTVLLPVTRLPGTYKAAKNDFSSFYGLSFDNRLETISSSDRGPQKDIVDLANRRQNMPRPQFTDGVYYGSDLGTELFFQTDSQSIYTYSLQYSSEIYRDGELIAITDNERSFIDESTVEGAEHSYTIRSIHPFGQIGPMSDAITVAAKSTSQSLPIDPAGSNRPNAPTGLRTEIYWFDVELFWDRNSTGAVESYEIRRNGELVGTTRGTSWYDDSTTSGEKYQYDVLSVGVNNQLLGIESVTVQVGPAECR